MNAKGQQYQHHFIEALQQHVGGREILCSIYGTEQQVMISLQSAEEGEEASVRGRVGQKLLDLSIKLKE